MPRLAHPDILAALVATLLLGSAAGPPAGGGAAADPDGSWGRLAPGLEFRLMDGGDACRKGSPRIAVVRFDAADWRVDLFHESEAGAGSADIDGWQRRTGADVMFNAGQYTPDRVPMGLFVKGGRNLGTKPHRAWKGVLVAEPEGDATLPRAAIIDLDHDSFDPAATPYRVAVQSFMILDRHGKKRVRRSDWHANRTVVATDGAGRLLVVHTEGAYTLWDLADWLDRAALDVTQALSLDGGFEAQMCVRAGSTDYLSFGQWSVDGRGDRSLPGARRKLPAAIGLFPRPRRSS